MTSLAAVLPRLAKQALGRRGFAEGTLLTDWAAIVGPEIAACTLPLKLAFAQGQRRDGTLHLRVAGAMALELQHLEPVILERINSNFGYRAVARLRFEQGPLPGVDAKKARRLPVTLDAAQQAALDRQVETVADPALRAALERLGKAVIGRRRG